MSKLSKFIGQYEEVDIMGEKLKLFPLTIKDLGLIDKMEELEKKKDGFTNEERLELTKMGRELIQRSFREEEITDKEIEDMGIDLYSLLYSTIMEKIIYTAQNGKGINRIRELKEKVIRQETTE
jgi:hypothetical protein